MRRTPTHQGTTSATVRGAGHATKRTTARAEPRGEAELHGRRRTWEAVPWTRVRAKTRRGAAETGLGRVTGRESRCKPISPRLLARLPLSSIALGLVGLVARRRRGTMATRPLPGLPAILRTAPAAAVLLLPLLATPASVALAPSVLPATLLLLWLLLLLLIPPTTALRRLPCTTPV